MHRYAAIRNVFRPTALVPNPYGWTRSQVYNRADVPSAWVDRPTHMSSEDVASALAYEWMESNQVGAGYSNPPFTSGTAGRLHPALRDETGQPARILRGFIRRANYDAGDPVSQARLYFMFNPEIITRDYVSYLDQASLDPFNTVFGSGNLVAPPSFMNFRFDLFFDRQTEAMQATHPGVLVDYQFFDLVVRNVVPSDPNNTVNNQLPDNGVMMVNPRDITVVFSPQMSVQGRPINAQVVFEKFTHRMTPVRMRISLEMRVIYFGPVLEQTEYRMQQSEFSAELAVPPTEDYSFSFTWNDIVVENLSDEGTAYAYTNAQAAAVGPANGAAGSGVVENPSGASGNATARGWGQPCHVTGGTTTISGGGKSVQGAALIADLGGRLLNETVSRGYQIRSLGCLCCRHVGGGNCNGGGNPSASWSNHAWGLAFDINPQQNPYQTGPLVTDMPGWMPQLWNAYGFRWGGTYSNKKDAMHYEFMGTVTDAAYHTDRAHQHGLGTGGAGHGGGGGARVAIRSASAPVLLSDEVPPFEEDEEDHPIPFYSQARECRTNYPFSCDASGLIWWSYNQLSLAQGLFPGPDAGVADMIQHFEATHWRYADLLMRWNNNFENTVAARNTLRQRVFEKDANGAETGVEIVDQAFLKEGDLLYRYRSPSGEGDHVSWFVRWAGDKNNTQMKLMDAHPTATPAVGERTVDYDYVIRSYTHAIRPQVIGALMPYRYAASVIQPVPIGEDLAS